MHSPDFTEQNVARLAELFPNCVTEAAGDDGPPKRTVDFDQLRQELSGTIVDGPRERYHLDWPGKKEALLAANSPVARTLRPSREESVEFDSTKSLYIEGDNLDALKLLQETYLNSMKMIYIDPPYNTGKDFIYDDDYSEDKSSYLQRSNQKDDSGNRMVANTEANGRFHSDWLSMMYPRLRLARTLLNSDGVIFISIDDNEAASLTRLCEEIFGKENFVASISVQVNPRGRHLDRFIAKTHEQILIFTKNSVSNAAMSGVAKSDRMVDEYDREDARGKHRLLGLRNRNQAFNPDTRPNLYYPLYVNPADRTLSVHKSTEHCDEVYPVTPDGVKTCWTWGKEKVTKEALLLTAEKTGGEWRVYRKDYLIGSDGSIATTLPKSVWLDKEFNNDYGRRSIKDLFGKSIMDFPKSVELIKHLVRIGCAEDGVVLDFFSGSAATAHAVMSLNAEDRKTRQFIMVQLPEPCDGNSVAYKAGFKTIAEIGKERIRRAGKTIKEENATTAPAIDVGFRVLKVDTSNMKDVYYAPDGVKQVDLLDQIENIKEGRTPEDLLFQVLLDWGVDLSLPIAKEAIEGKTVFFVDGNALAACFDKDINEDLVKTIAARKPLRAVFRDSGYGNDSVKINVEQIFKLISPSTEVKSI